MRVGQESRPIVRSLAAIALVMGGLLTERSASARDEWIVARTPVVETARPIELVDYVGERLLADERRRFDRALTRRFAAFHGVAGEVETDLLPSASDGMQMELAFPSEGGWIVILDRPFTPDTLPAADFEALLREEGLDSILAERARRGESAMPGREHSARCLKAFVRVGARADVTYARQVGQLLELVPLEDPTRVAPGTTLDLDVRYFGGRLAGAQVDLLTRGASGVTRTRAVSDERGIVTFTVPELGTHVARMVYMRRCIASDERGETIPCNDVEWETLWSSLSFASADPTSATVTAPDMLGKHASRPHARPRRRRVVVLVIALALVLAAALVWRRRRASDAPIVR